MPYRTVNLFTLYSRVLEFIFLNIVTKHSNDNILLINFIISNNSNSFNKYNRSRGFAKSNFSLLEHM
jgi:hypothetical protein